MTPMFFTLPTAYVHLWIRFSYPVPRVASLIRNYVSWMPLLHREMRTEDLKKPQIPIDFDLYLFVGRGCALSMLNFSSDQLRCTVRLH